MRRSPILIGALLLVPLLAGCLGGDGPDEGVIDDETLTTITGELAFTNTVVDTIYGTGEPSILAAPDGTLWIAGPTGFVSGIVEQDPVPYTHDSGLFSSKDGGETWEWNEMIPGYGRDACVGGGDSDIAASPDGALFLIDLNLENVPIDVSMDGGATWTSNCMTSIVPGVDRQWVAATNDYVWISVNHLALGPIVYRSDRLGLPTDGLIFGAPVMPPVGGAIVVDSLDGTLYLAGSGATMAVSHDNGDTWTAHDTGLQGHALGASFVSVAVDAVGNVFVLGAGDEGILITGSTDQGETWTNATVFRPYEGDYGFAWVAAGGDGVVDFAWYGRPAENDTTEFHQDLYGYYVFAGQSLDLLEAGPDASAAVALVDPEPVTIKNLCMGINLITLTPCDVEDPSATRALGDFFEAGVDLEGNLIMSYVSEYEVDGYPILKFAKQTLGELAPPQLE